MVPERIEKVKPIVVTAANNIPINDPLRSQKPDHPDATMDPIVQPIENVRDKYPNSNGVISCRTCKNRGVKINKVVWVTDIRKYDQ